MDADEFPQSPSKRMKLDAEHMLATPDEMQVDDPDDFYDEDNAAILNNVKPGAEEKNAPAADAGAMISSNEVVVAPSTLPATNGSVQDAQPDSKVPVEDRDQIPDSKAEANTPSLVHDVSPAGDPPPTASTLPVAQGTDVDAGEEASASRQAVPEGTSADTEFLEAAKQNKGDANAEWRFDSSDAESSSDDSSDASSDSSSEEDSDEDAVLLDPAEAARMLMKEEGGDDGEGDKGPKGPIKTQNELDITFTKPDITITPEMTVVELGAVDNIIGNLVLIKANTSGEYRVLESGSLLCLPDRRVVGEVWEPLGRVHDPMYSVGFQQASDIEELGITRGTNVCYVEQHSTYVFTQTIRNLKGSDASNMHDEEAYGEEVEFSDDEKEAEYKRNLKQARQAKKAAAQGVPQNMAAATGANAYEPRNTYDPPIQTASYPDAISYDDEEAEDMYKPLARPDNLSQMMGGPAPPLARRGHDHPRGRFDGRGRGDRGRGRGRGRGDRGGRGGNFQRGRGDRGQGYSRDQQSSEYDRAQQQYDSRPTPQQSSPYQSAQQSWPVGTPQQAAFGFPPQLPHPPPPPAMFQQQAPVVQQQSFDPQAWAQYFQQQAVQAQQQQQQQQYAVQGAAPAQAGTQQAQNSLSSLIQSLTQNGTRPA